MKTYRLFFVSVYRFIWNTFLYDISSILLIIIFKLTTPFIFNYTPPLIAVSAYKQKTFDIVVFFFLIHSALGTT